MEDLSYSSHLDHETVSFIDYVADANAEGRVYRGASASPSVFRAAGLFDSLSAYATVFGCSGNCSA